eukprot:558558-Amphidinium_carterae.1
MQEKCGRTVCACAGMFLESALEGSRLQADADIVSKLRDIFLDMGVSEAGLITWQDFKVVLSNPSPLCPSNRNAF